MIKLRCLLCKESKKCKKSFYYKFKSHKKEFDKPVNIKFSSLAPLYDIDDVKCKTYYKALDYALKEENIHNIAITGTYGAGKSTVINSYFHDKCRNDILKISLATFFLEKKDAVPLPEIEKSILQQIFYRKKATSFPFSRFKRIKSYSIKKTLFKEFCLIVSIIFSIKLLKPDCLKSFFYKIANHFKLNELINNFPKVINGIDLCLFLVGIFCFFYIGFVFTRFLYKVRPTKFSFQKLELGLDDIESESLLNKYFDELLYFFEITNLKIVIFEDLDRFRNPEIFFNLRELNSLINNYEKIKNKVVFIYALKDELFDDVDRTKFFDFIIPIVPIIDTHNSKDIMLKKQRQIRSFSKVEESFINEISKYINDMRLLINCINEFQMYDEVLDSNNKTRLFALILYKNFYPKDFAELTNEKIQEEVNKPQNEKDKPLKYYLLKNKYITKDYIYNISRYYFRDNGNKQTDKEFLDLVENDKKPDFTKKLEDTANVVARIKNNKWWSNNAILNNNLLNFLLKDEKDYFEENLESFIVTMYSYDKYHLKNKFFKQYKPKNTKESHYLYKHIIKYIQSDNDLNYEIFFDGNHEKLKEILLVIDYFEDKFKDFIKKQLEFLVPATWDIAYNYFIKIDNKKLSTELIDFMDRNYKNLSNALKSNFDKTRIKELVNTKNFSKIKKPNLRKLLKDFEKS